MHALRSIVSVACIASVACARDAPATNDSLGLHGALVNGLTWVPTKPSDCAATSREYTEPYHRAPYRDCRHQSGTSWEVIEIDADALVLTTDSFWTVAAANRRAEFARAESTISRRLGPGNHCFEGRVAWQQSDTLQASLNMRPQADVADQFEKVPWQIHVIQRLRPLEQMFSCH